MVESKRRFFLYIFTVTVTHSLPFPVQMIGDKSVQGFDC